MEALNFPPRRTWTSSRGGCARSPSGSTRWTDGVEARPATRADLRSAGEVRLGEAERAPRVVTSNRGLERPLGRDVAALRRELARPGDAIQPQRRRAPPSTTWADARKSARRRCAGRRGRAANRSTTLSEHERRRPALTSERAQELADEVLRRAEESAPRRRAACASAGQCQREADRAAGVGDRLRDAIAPTQRSIGARDEIRQLRARDRAAEASRRRAGAKAPRPPAAAAPQRGTGTNADGSSRSDHRRLRLLGRRARPAARALAEFEYIAGLDVRPPAADLARTEFIRAGHPQPADLQAASPDRVDTVVHCDVLLVPEPGKARSSCTTST